MGVTAFKSLANYSTYWARITDCETHSRRDIGPGDVMGFDYWVPWCTDQAGFPEHHIQLDLFAAKPTAHTTLHPVKSYSIWQSADADGDFLRYSTDGKYHGRNDQLSGGGTPGPHVSGVAAVDGNRLVKVHGDTFEVRASG